MIPRVADTGPGRSFKGAGLYYLHDKDAQTTERVEFIHTLNLPVRDDDEPQQTAQRAINMMAFTALHQRDIRKAAGGRYGGETCERPVYTFSLSWREGETPSREHMLETAQSAVKALGLSEHQVLMVSHTDAPCRHLHVIANLVHPETGRSRNMWHDHYKLSRWAEDYEKKYEIQCHLRVENNRRRARGEFVKYDDLTRQEWAIIKKYQTMTAEDIRTQRAEQQLSDREDMIARHDQRKKLLAKELVDFYGPGRSDLEATLREIEKRIGVRGRLHLYARRLTGAERRDQRLYQAVKRSIADTDTRMSERRHDILKGIEIEKQLLAARHDAQRKRDEALIATARQRTEKERAGERMRKHYRIRAHQERAKHTPTEAEADMLRQAYRQAAELARKNDGQSGRKAENERERDADDQKESRSRSRRGTRGQNRTPGRKRHRPRRRDR